jgi:hypothetical protein
MIGQGLWGGYLVTGGKHGFVEFRCLLQVAGRNGNVVKPTNHADSPVLTSS